MNNRQIWENIFQLSQAVFRVTHLFPREEILRRHLRAKATEILYQASQSVIAISPSSAIRPDESPFRRVASNPSLPLRANGESEARLNDYSVGQAISLQGDIIFSLHNFRGLLFFAKNCNFVNEQNFAVLIKECAKIIEILETSPCHSDPPDICYPTPSNIRHPERSEGSQKPILLDRDSSVVDSLRMTKSGIGFFAPNLRQQKLLDYLQKCQDEKLKLKDIAEEFKNVQPRTVRQDLKELCDGGYLTRNGRGAGSYYILPKNNTS